MNTAPTTLPFGVNKGKTTNTILSILDEAGNVIGYTCADCDKTFSKYAAAFGHRKAHSNKPAKGDKQSSLAPLMEVLDENDRLRRQVAGLKSRLGVERQLRKDAERQIQRIERLFERRS